MSETNKFFLWAGRLTTIVVLLAILGVGASIIYFSMMSDNWRERREVKAAVDNNKVPLLMGQLEEVKGSGVQIVDLYSLINNGLPSSGYKDQHIRNILFVGQDMKSSHWLFPTNNYWLSYQKLSFENESGEQCCKVAALYYQVVKADTDGNGQLDDGDRVTVSLSKPDGTGYLEVLKNVKKVIDNSLTEDGQCIAVLHQQEQKILYSCFDPQTFAKKSEFTISSINGS